MWEAPAFPTSLFPAGLPCVEVQGDVPALQQGWMTQRLIYKKGERRRQETPSWALCLFGRRCTCWHGGMDLVSSWLKDQVLLPLVFTEITHSTGAVCCPLQLLAEKWIPSPAWWCALWRVQAAQLCQPASERGLLSICWVSWVHGAGEWESRASLPQGDRMPLALREDHCVSWRGCLVSSSTPSTRRDEERGS